jgi:hypothetical protein
MYLLSLLIPPTLSTVPYPEQYFAQTTTSQITLTIGNSTIQPYLPSTDRFTLQRRGIRGRTALRKCAPIGQTGECPVDRTVRKFFGSIYAYWQENLRFNCAGFPAVPFEGQPRKCHYLAETCADDTTFRDAQGLTCEWYAENNSRCVDHAEASDACCACNGGLVTSTLVQCATENSACNLPGTFASQGGAWIYVGAIADHSQTGSTVFTCGLSTVDPVDSEIGAERFCYVADTRNLGAGWRNVTTGAIETEWKVVDMFATPVMPYEYRLMRMGEVSDTRRFFAAPATGTPVPKTAGDTITGRLTLQWDEPTSYVKPVRYEIFVNGNFVMETGERVWSLTDCEENAYYDIFVVSIADGVRGRSSRRLGRFCGDPPGPPSKPKLVRTTCNQLSDPPTITIRWTPPDEAGSKAITSFRFLRSVEPALDNFVLIDPVSGVEAHVTEFTDEFMGDIKIGKVYKYKVFATNGIDDAELTHASVPLTVLCN